MKLERRVRQARAEDHHDGEVSEVFRRLGAAEGRLVQLGEQVIGVASQLEHQDRQLSSMEAQLSAIANSLQSKSATDWKALAAWASVLLTLVVLYTTLTTSPMREAVAQNRSDILDLNTRVATADRQYLLDMRQSTAVDIAEAEKRGARVARLEALERQVFGSNSQ